MSARSEKMKGLLQELAQLKDLDDRWEAGSKSEIEVDELRERQKRRSEIGEEIKALADQDEN
jgi:hypothetical protein